MFRNIKIISVVTALLISTVAIAQAPSSAPAGSTGMCRDGSYWTGATKKGACRGHKGVQDWYAGSDSSGSSAPAAATAAPAASSTASPTAPPAASPGVSAAPAAAPAASTKSSTMPSSTPAPGGGPGQVWVNSSTKVYHCSSDRWYGKTKKGEYMTESDAVAKGNRPDHGKACK